MAIRFALGLLAAVLALPSHGAWAVGEPVNGFPNWAERVIHEWMNRARVDPQLEMTACGSPCLEAACYSVLPPLSWSLPLNRSARFHSDEMVRQSYFAHDSACTIVSNINSIYPGTCNGTASCACVGGTRTCSPTCTDTWGRIALFGGYGSGEIIASPSDPNYAFYLWLYEQGDTTTCQFTSRNGHRWLILESTGAVGAGVAGYSTGDFGSGSAAAKIPSAAHYPQQAASVEVWANWYDTAGPSSASVNVDGTCTVMSRRRGSATNGAWSATITGAGSGCHRYYVSFVDGTGTTVTYPTTGSLAIGSGAGCPDWDNARPAACGGAATPTPSPTPTPTPLPATATPTRTPTAAPTATPTTSPTVTATPLRYDLSGAIQYYSNAAPVPQVNVHAAGAATDVSAPTDASGRYALTGLAAEDITIAPNKTGDLGAAVSALDAAYTLQSVVGMRTLSTFQQLACDVSGNGSLSALDASLILERTVGLRTTFPVASQCQSDWAFVPTAPPGPLPISPQPGPTPCLPGALQYRPLTASLTGQSFLGVLFGDCTGNWQAPGGPVSARGAGRDAPSVRAGALRRLRGGRVELPIFVGAAGAVTALEVRIDYDPTSLRTLAVRPVGAARGAILAVNTIQPGTTRIAAASAQGIAAGSAPVLVVRFESHGRGTVTAPLVTGRVDDH